MKISLRHVAVAFAVLGGAQSAQAQSVQTGGQPSTATYAPPAIYAPDWVVTVSGQGYVAPQYPGAKSYGPFGAPGLNIHRSTDPERFYTPDDGFGVPLYDTIWFRVGPVVRYLGNRSVGGNRDLFGLPNVNASLELGGFVEANPLPFIRTRLEVLQAVTGNDGLVFNLGADVWRRWGAWTFSVGPRFVFGNDKYAQSYFSVTPEQAFINRFGGGSLTAYNAVGGLTSAGLATSLRYEIDENWRATLFGGYQRLTGSVSNSPIVTVAGSENQFVGGLELAYRFHMAPLF